MGHSHCIYDCTGKQMCNSNHKVASSSSQKERRRISRVVKKKRSDRKERNVRARLLANFRLCKCVRRREKFSRSNVGRRIIHDQCRLRRGLTLIIVHVQRQMRCRFMKNKAIGRGGTLLKEILGVFQGELGTACALK